MALGLSFAANLQPNLVLMPTPMVCRIAAQMTGTVGTFTISGTPAGALQWSLQGAPAGGSVTLVPQTGGASAALMFNNIPQRTAPYILVISVTDGTTLVQSSLALVVRPGLQILQQAVDGRITGSNPWTVTGNAYDATLPTLKFSALAGSTVLTNAQFIAPDTANMLPGLAFQLTQDGAALMAVAQPSPLSATGGIRTTSQSEPVSFQVYEPDTLYDSPANTLTVNVVYALNAVGVGNLAAGLGGSYDPITNDIFLRLDLLYQGGMPQTYDIAWSVSAGATGSWSGGAPGSNATSVTWVPSGSAAQSVTFTATITDPAHLSSPLALSAGPFEVAPAGSWIGTAALQVQLPQGQIISQDQGKTAWIAVELPDLQSGETAVVTLTPSSLPTPMVTDPAASSFTITPGAPAVAFFAFPVPANAPLNQMWKFSVAVVATTSVTTRSGFGQLVLVSNGAPQLVVTPASLSLSASAGSPVAPVSVTVQAWTQLPMTLAEVQALSGPTLTEFLSSSPNSANSTLNPVAATLTLASAPTGLACSGGQLSGSIAQSGFFGCTLLANAAGYQTGSSAELAVTVTGSDPFVGVVWQNPAFSFSGGNLSLNWGTSGSPVGLQLQESTTAATPNVVEAWAAPGIPSMYSVALPGTEAFLLVASNALGSAYSQPIVVQPTTGSSASLPIAPVTATLDSAGNLVLDWTPPAVDNTAYSYWTVWAATSNTALPFALPSQTGHPGLSLQAADGGGPGSTYTYSTALGSAGAGYLALQMRAFGPAGITSALWDSYDTFPAPQGAYLSKAAAEINEPVTVFLEPIAAAGSGPAGDSWWIEIQNGSASPIISNRMPLTITAVPLALPSSMTGSNTVTVFVSKTYINSDGTPITLVRSFQVALPLVISSGVYQGNPLAYPEAPGFEVAGSDGTTPTLADYMVIAPALVRDETTHELKLLLATARGASASSQFGTLAADVFPLQGRPYTADLLDVTAALSLPATVAPPLLVITTGLEAAVAGEPVVPFQLQAKGGVAPYQWFARNLPQGMYLSRDGVMTGAPIDVGLFQVVVSVQDAQSPAFLTDVTLSLQVSRSNITIAGALDGLGNAVSALPNAHVGTYYSAGIQAKQGIEPYTWSLLTDPNTMPPGLSLNPDTGAITGWASTDGTLTGAGLAYTPTIEVTDAVGATASQAFPLTLLPMVLTLGNPDQSLLLTGVDTQVCIPITGGAPPYSLVTPTLPYGFSAATLVNGVIKIVFPRGFVPAVPSGGGLPQVPFSLTVTDHSGASITQTYTFTMTPANTMASWKDAFFPSKVGGLLGGGALPSGIVGGPTPIGDGADAVSFTGLNSGDTVTLSVTPSLLAVTADDPNTVPAQVSLTNVLFGSSTGTNQEVTVRAVASNSSGLAYEQVAREYSIGSLVYDSTGYTRQFITVNPTPVALYEVFAFDPQCPARNASAPTISFDLVSLASSSLLPEGVSLDSVTGMLYGAVQTVPAPGASSVLNYSLSGTQVAQLTVLWDVIPADLIVTPSGTIPGAAGNGYPQVQAGQPYHAVLSVANATLEGLASVSVIHGSLPQGVSPSVVQGNSSTNQPPTIVLSGTAAESGVFDPVIRVVDSNGVKMGLFKVRIVVNASQLLNLVTAGPLDVVSGLVYSTRLVAIGGMAPYTWAISSSSTNQLPAGITLNAATGVLSGTTTVSGWTGTSHPVTFQVTDSFGVSIPKVIYVTANPASALGILTTGLPAGVVGGAYEAPLLAFGGIPPYTWSMTPTHPFGLSLNPSTGVISGIPAGVSSGTESLTATVTVTDSTSPTPGTATASLTLTVGAAGSPNVVFNLPDTSTPPVYSTGITPREGYIGVAYGSPDTSSLLPTGSCGTMNPAAPGFAWAQAHSLTLGGTPFLVAVGGFRRPVTGSLYALSGVRPAQPSAPLFFNPAIVSSGVPVGHWGVMAGVFDPSALNHMLAASCAISANEIVVIGGVANDQCSTQGLGTSLNQASMLAFSSTVDGSGNVVPTGNQTAYSWISGSDTILSGAFPLDTTNPVITQRYGAAAVKLATDSIMLCGGISRTVPSPATPGVPGVRNDLTVDGSGNYRSQYAYVLQVSRTGGVVSSSGVITPTSATWTQLTPMPVPLAFHRAVRLADGRVMVFGGVQDLQGESSAWTPAPDGQGSNLCLIYDQTLDPLFPGSTALSGSQPWSIDTSMPVQVFSPAACLLPNGQVFVGAPASSPYANHPGNEVNGIPLSSTNCVLLYTPGTSGHPGSWAVFPTSQAGTGSNPRTQIPWGASAHVFGAGIVALVGGEQNMTGDGNTLQNPLVAPWNGSFDPNAIGLQGSLFNAALVGMDPTYSTPAVYSNPAVPAFYFSTNTKPLAGIYLSASGGVPPYHSWTVTPALPTGMNLDSDTGEITGTPTAATPPGQEYAFAVLDSHVPTPAVGSLTVPFQILDPTAPIWTTPGGSLSGSPWVEGPYGSPTPPAPVSVSLQAYAWFDDSQTTSYNLTSVGTTLTCSVVGQSYQANLSSPLNPLGAPTLASTGISISSSGLVSGVPTIPGIYGFQVRVSNSLPNIEQALTHSSVRDYLDRTFSITVNGNLILSYSYTGSGVYYPGQVLLPGLSGAQTSATPTPSTLPIAVLGQPYAVTFTVANGTAPYTWSATGLPGGSLSGGLSLSTSTGASATISATSVTPVAGVTSTTLTASVTVTDANGIVQTALLSIPVGEAAITATSPLPVAVVAQPYDQTFTLSGGYLNPGGNYLLSTVHTTITGLPTGMNLVPGTTPSNWAITGTPTSTFLGTNYIQFWVTDNSTPTPNDVEITIELPVAMGVYTWVSGPQTTIPGLWSSYDFHASSSMLPLGICWDRFPSSGYSNPGAHAQDNLAWTVQVTGTFQHTNPTLSLGGIGGVYDNVTWTATRIQDPTVGGTSTAIFAISFTYSGVLSLPSTFYLQCTLVDGVTADTGYLGGFFRATGPGAMSRPDATDEVFVTTSGTLPLTTYTG